MRVWSYPILVALILLLALACTTKRPGHRTVKIDESFVLAEADAVQFTDEKVSLWLQLQQIEDSRCPLNVNCITAGKASIRLQLNQQEEEIILCLGTDCFGENENNFFIRVNNRGYNIVLEEVRPYPSEDGVQIPKQAVLKIKRVTG